jgi:hypothetical protein
VSGEANPAAKLKHLSAQLAMEPQPSTAISQGSVAGGQQACCGSTPDVSALSGDFRLNAAAPAAGNSTTDTAMRAADMIRAMPIEIGLCSDNSRSPFVRPSEDFAFDLGQWLGAMDERQNE